MTKKCNKNKTKTKQKNHQRLQDFGRSRSSAIDFNDSGNKLTNFGDDITMLICAYIFMCTVCVK